MANQKTTGRGRINEKIGIVVSDKANKTISVEMTRVVRHERYSKYIKLHSRFLVHDENNEAKVGDRISFVEGRPLSKLKRWKLTKILEKATVEGVES